MSWRDRPFDQDINLAVFTPLTPDAVARAERGFLAWAQSPASRPFRYRRGARPGVWHRVADRDVAARAAAAIQRLPGRPDLAEVERVVRRHEFRDLGLILVVWEDTVALSLCHRFSDGLLALPIIRSVMAAEPMARPRWSATPLLRALAATRQLSLGGLRAGRAYLREGDVEFPRGDAGRVAADDTVQVAQHVIPAADLQRATAAERERLGDGARLATTEVLGGVALRALRACLQDGRDLPVVMTVGLRRFLPDGLGARGNFITTTNVGTLRGVPWDATDLRDRAFPRARDPRAVPGFVIQTLAPLRERLRRAGRPLPHAESEPIGAVLNLLRGDVGIGAADYRAGEVPRPALFMVHRGLAIGPHCSIVTTGSDYVASVLDDSGLVDLTRFPAALDAELRALGVG